MLERVRVELRRLRGSKVCPACRKPVNARQRSMEYRGQLYHRRCVAYVPSAKR